jgi:hypothetical protein
MAEAASQLPGDAPGRRVSKPPCDTRFCSGNGDSKEKFWSRPGTCAGYDVGQDFESQLLHKFYYACPGAVGYWTCRIQEDSNMTCNTYTAPPSCPSGSCDPYFGGKPG